MSIKPLSVMNHKLKFYICALLLFQSIKLYAQGGWVQFDFNQGMTLGGKVADGSGFRPGEGSSNKNNNPNTQKSTPPPIVTQIPPSPPNPFDTKMPLLSPISKKTLQDIRKLIYARNFIKIALLSGYVLDFFTSNKWEQSIRTTKAMFTLAR